MVQKWSEKEQIIFVAAVKLHGTGNWTKIIKITGLPKTSMQLKDKWRNLKKTEYKDGRYCTNENIITDLVIPSQFESSSILLSY